MAITFELTRDQDLLGQYYRLRQTCYREELGLAGFDGSEEPRDRVGRTLVARDGGACIGGARIVPACQDLTAKVDPGGSADDYCAWERFALDPDIRSAALARAFCAHLIDRSRSMGYARALVLSSRRNARFYRQCHSALGITFDIVGAVPGRGHFGGLEHYLSVSRLTSGASALPRAA
jgi:GNAT superfamily N-acetyltransferase